MAEMPSVGDIAKSIGDLVAGFVPEGPLRTVVFLAYGLCDATTPLIYKYYLGVLAQGAKKHRDKRAFYLRRNLATLCEGWRAGGKDGRPVF